MVGENGTPIKTGRTERNSQIFRKAGMYDKRLESDNLQLLPPCGIVDGTAALNLS